MKKLLELFEKLVGISKRTSDPKIINELQTLATKIENLSVNPSLDSLSQTEQIKAVAEDLLKLETKAIDQIDSGISKIDELENAYGLNDKPSVTNRPQGKSADMYDSAERSIQFVAEKTGLSFEEARLAIMEKMNEGYAIGDPKRTRPNELASIKAYLDVNLDYGATDAIMFLEDIEEIAFSGSIDLASDTAKNVSKQNAKQIIDSSNPGEEFGETLIDFDDAPKTLEDTFKNVPPERRAVMEELYAPVIEEQKIIEATQKEIQQTAAKIQDLAQQGKFEEAEALAESLKEFQEQLKSGNAMDATIIPPDRTLNAKGGRIGISSLFKRR